MSRYVDEFIKSAHELYQLQKDSLNFLIKGETGALLLLYEGKNITPSIMSKLFKVSSARISRTLNSLEKKNYIKRIDSLDDKRVTFIELTESGTNEAKYLKEKYYSSLNNLFKELGDDDSEKIIELLNKTIKIMKNENKG